MDSILASVKKVLGITEDYEHFDADIILYINSAFSTLTQLGVGPRGGFYIEDSASVWSDFLPEGTLLNLVKAYIPKRVKLSWDNSTLTGSLLESLKNEIAMDEWRINVEAETPLL